jgi:hypothetical protein
MKKLLLLFMIILLLPLTGNSQSSVKGMVKIDMPQEERVVEVNATVKYASESGTIIITRNKVDVYEITTGSKLVVGSEYFFILRVPVCIDCPTIKAELLGYELSVQQAYDNITKLREKVKRQELKD